MVLKINVLGNTIASNQPPTPKPVSTSAVLELLTALEGEVEAQEHSNLRTAVQRYSDFLNVPVEQLAIGALDNVGPSFTHYLIKRHYKYHAARSYCNCVKRLVAYAKQLGFLPAHPEVAGAWKEILAVMPKDGCRGIIRFAIERNKKPEQLTDLDLAAYRQAMLDRGKTYGNPVRHTNTFLRVLSKSCLAHKFPQLTCSTEKHPRYGILSDLLPAPLPADIEHVLQAKQAQYAPGRGKRIRLITARNVKSALSRYCGYAINIAGIKTVCSLPQLFTKELVVGYISFCLNERRLKGDSVLNQLRSMHAALKCHPAYKEQEFSWFRSVVSKTEIEPEPAEAIRERKLQKYTDYENLLNMRPKMHARRKEAEKLGALSLARAVHDELLIAWWVTLVWRQSNIREIKIGHNLFRAPIPPLVNMTIPSWVRDGIKANPEEAFWQFHFPESETKTHGQKRSVLPRCLVAILEEYLAKYRPLLLCGSDPGTLFLNRNGRPLTSDQFADLVSKLTWKYAQRRVTPHMIRDIFAYWWLRHYPADYLTLSKMLWHSNIQTTINIYASKFDESAALCRVEECLEQRANQSGFQALQLAKAKSSGGETLPLPKAPVTKTLAPGSVIGGGLKKAA